MLYAMLIMSAILFHLCLCLPMIDLLYFYSIVQPHTSGTSSCCYPGCKNRLVYSPKWRRIPLYISKLFIIAVGYKAKPIQS